MSKEAIEKFVEEITADETFSEEEFKHKILQAIEFGLSLAMGAIPEDEGDYAMDGDGDERWVPSRDYEKQVRAAIQKLIDDCKG